MCWVVQCKCGHCNDVIVLRDYNYRYRKYKNNHYWNGKTGDKASNWKGGRRKVGNYWHLYMPDYFSSSDDGIVAEHIYNFQEYNKCCMLPWGIVHHIEPVTKDYCNNMPWNLQGVTYSQHMKLHNPGEKYCKKDMSDRFCLICGSKTTYISIQKLKYKTPRWYKHKDGFVCSKCYDKNRRKHY